MKVTTAFVCVALSLTGAACTIGPVADDAGATPTSPATPMTLGDQCQDVIIPFCRQLPGCAINVALAACIANYLPLCCTGSSCMATSTVSQATVTACAQMNAKLDCNAIANTMNPAACLTAM